jgi:serine beta-lactamase-like protein LACTB, mitochondrial
VSSSWKQTGLTVIACAAGLIFAVGVGIYSFLNSTAIKVHSGPQDVPSVPLAAPAAKWTIAADRARQFARAMIVHNNLPGMSVAVGAGGELVWAEGFGWADLEKRIPVAPNTRFRIGHASNAITSAAVGLLLEKQQLHLNDEIQTYVPAFPRKQWPVTLRQLMAHTSGIRHYDNEADYMPTERCARAAEGLARFADDPLRFEPDTRDSYSTFGWILVSAAVESAASEPFFAFVRTNVLQPLAMVDTTIDAGTDPMPNRANFYYPRFSGETSTGAQLAAPVDYSCFAGAGGFLSTPSDLVRFGLAMMNGTLLQPGTVTRLQTAQQLASGAETGYGLGWMLETIPVNGQPRRMVHHASRTIVGGTTTFMTFPDLGLVVAVTTNVSLATTKLTALKVAEAFAERR